MAIDGTYTFVVESPRGSMKDHVTLVTKGETVSGTFEADRHGVVPLNGKVNGNEVEWSMNLYLRGGETPGGGPPGGETPGRVKTEVRFKGTITGNKLSGKLLPGSNQVWDATGERVS